MQYQYRIYGLVISANIEFPNFVAVAGDIQPDITLHMNSESADLSAFDQILRLSYKTAASSKGPFAPLESTDQQSGNFCYLVTYWGGLEFVVDANGSEIWCQWTDETSFGLVMAYLFGPILGLILRLREVVCLHASVVSIDDHAIAFIAPSGGGKSTLAAALSERGFPILSDDLLVVDTKGGEFLTFSGHPGLRLCDDSYKAVFQNKNASVRQSPQGDKLLLEQSEQGDLFSSNALPLGAVYTRLSDGEDPHHPEFESFLGSSALLTLLSNTYPGHYYHLPKSIHAGELARLKTMSQHVPVRGIKYKRSLKDLPELCDAVIQDARDQITSIKHTVN